MVMSASRQIRMGYRPSLAFCPCQALLLKNTKTTKKQKHFGEDFLYYGEDFLYYGEDLLYYGEDFLYYGEEFLYYGGDLLFYGEDFLWGLGWPCSCFAVP